MSTIQPFEIRKGLGLRHKKSGKIHKVTGSKGDGDRWRLSDIPHNAIDKRTIWGNYEPYCIKCKSILVDGKCSCPKISDDVCPRCEEKPLLQGHKVCIDCHIEQRETQDMNKAQRLLADLNEGKVTEGSIEFVSRFVITKDGSEPITAVRDYNENSRGRTAWPAVCKLALLLEKAKKEKLDIKAFTKEAKADATLTKYNGPAQLLGVGPWEWKIPFEQRTRKAKETSVLPGFADKKKSLAVKKEKLRQQLRDLEKEEESLDDSTMVTLMGTVKKMINEAKRLGFNKGVNKVVDGVKMSIRFKDDEATITVREEGKHGV